MDNPEALSEIRRLQIIDQIRADAAAAGRADFDVDSMIAGHLAGPASPDRPNVPVWEYRAYVEASGSTIKQLAGVRFPVEFFVGGSTVTSIAEELRPLPVPSGVSPTAEDILRQYEMMHSAGVLWVGQRHAVDRASEGEGRASVGTLGLVERASRFRRRVTDRLHRCLTESVEGTRVREVRAHASVPEEQTQVTVGSVLNSWQSWQ